MTTTVGHVSQPNIPTTLVTGRERHWAPRHDGDQDPAGHLTIEQIDAIGAQLDEIRQEVFDSLDEKDAAYIRNLIRFQRGLDLASRGVLLFSGFAPAWIIGTIGLSCAKIIDNMEIGHNVMHGQWDWMRDPKIHSTVWEWDNTVPSESWKHTHNEIHHTYTNVLGKDNDLGYGYLRVDEDQKWMPFYLWQPLLNVINASLFELGIAVYDLEPGRVLSGRASAEEKKQLAVELKRVWTKVRRQSTKDYIIHPLLSGPNFLPTLAANLTANFVRNWWTHGVIVCGHFPFGVETFAKKSVNGETRGEWYLRQMLGSANIDGSKAMHLMTGNLSHQIEHHVFPDMPSNRYQEVAPKVRKIMADNGLNYVTGPLWKQYASAWGKAFYYAVPNGTWDVAKKKGPVSAVKFVVNQTKQYRRDKTLQAAAQAERRAALSRPAAPTPDELTGRPEPLVTD